MRPRHPLLQRRVASIDVIESAGGAALVLPAPAAVLGIQLEGRVQSLSRAGVTGIPETAKTYSYLGVTRSVLVRFAPQGAASLGVPAHALAGKSVALESFLNRSRVAQLLEQMDAEKDESAKVWLVESFLAEFADGGDRMVEEALRQLRRTDSHLQQRTHVSSVAKALGISERQLRRRFLARVGVTPQQFVSLERFEHAVQYVRSSTSLAEAAHRAGYADQSHFNREFRHFTGRAPGQVL